ncbi:hypothetical protein OCU04_003020 [Sclerotinia nivalis]|uniref:Uncharacterized protein n=1 Tax=Sclerotinia nivalis TaxID=352851 RepID=A0A9X0AUU3_9HELO|nr:hypothetical protein OCU04_003020 [Sclerotinia nivalis]
MNNFLLVRAHEMFWNSRDTWKVCINVFEEKFVSGNDGDLTSKTEGQTQYNIGNMLEVINAHVSGQVTCVSLTSHCVFPCSFCIMFGRLEISRRIEMPWHGTDSYHKGQSDKIRYGHCTAG